MRSDRRREALVIQLHFPDHPPTEGETFSVLMEVDTENGYAALPVCWVKRCIPELGGGEGQNMVVHSDADATLQSSVTTVAAETQQACHLETLTT